MLPWFHDASSGSTSSLTPWSCKLLHMAKLWGTQALKQDGEVRWAHGVRATRPLRKQRPSCSNPTVSFSLACAPRRVLRIRGALSMPRLSSGTLSDSPRNSANPKNASPLHHGGEHFRPSRGSPGFNPRRRVLILRGTFLWVSHCRCPVTPQS
jgi:hypothetical protein